ncbi:hypothetical protein F2P56_024609 [Juglans regia]|uniref:Uncharacterized protein n=2 Tax=Juglans regia TaxID=51240 RepID=A0A833X0P1_JUGRE|nr:uncharacterized protein LOC109017965 [Juglans regia]KAF5454989.1 hypothetical protein F2P56_024609 [Juglans regia]
MEGKRRAESQINLFREVFEDCGLGDLGCSGHGFTCSNKHSDQSFTKERLDRFVVNDKCKSLYKEMRVEALSGRCSDHLPILLSMDEGEQSRMRKLFPFRFEACWIKQEECVVIRRGWVKGQSIAEPFQRFQARLKICSGSLSSYFKRSDKGRGGKIEQMSCKIKKIQENLCQENMEELKALQEKVGVLLEKEDVKWKQRAKRNWFNLGLKMLDTFMSVQIIGGK